MRRAVRNERGVTLIEMMVVVAIIAIIAAIAIVTGYQDMVRKSKFAADLGIAAALRSAVAIHYARNNGSFPPDQATLDQLVTPLPTFQCSGQSYTYEAASGDVTLTVTDASNC